MSAAKSTLRAKAKSKSLKSGRPPLLSSTAGTTSTTTTSTSTSSNPSTSISSKHTRSVIRQHHVLQKRLAAARARNDEILVRDLEAEIAAQGGLRTYQHASQVGQSAARGGDSSRVLVQWLHDEIELRRRPRQHRQQQQQQGTGEQETNSFPQPPPLRILEVGALSTTNALNVRGATVVRRIDLRSSGPGIEEMDFMDLPLPVPVPASDADADADADAPGGEGAGGYDVLSLSLVLNYVPDAAERGRMLRRTTLFFPPQPHSHSHSHSHSQSEAEAESESRPQVLPCLFLVLPSPTLHNSRYLTPQHLSDMLSSLGYTHLHTKTTRKLHYSLWRFDGQATRDDWVRGGGETVFRKKEIHPGKGRNNFCIVLE